MKKTLIFAIGFILLLSLIGFVSVSFAVQIEQYNMTKKAALFEGPVLSSQGECIKGMFLNEKVPFWTRLSDANGTQRQKAIFLRVLDTQMMTTAQVTDKSAGGACLYWDFNRNLATAAQFFRDVNPDQGTGTLKMLAQTTIKVGPGTRMMSSHLANIPRCF